MAHLEHSLFIQISNRLKNLQIDTVFDVGANVGQSSERFRAELPSATIFAFEPVTKTYSKLVEHFKDDKKFKPYKLAFGTEPAVLCMTSNGTSVGNRIIPGGRSDIETENVEVVRGDDLMHKESISRINYLKIDAEGHDLHVLQGFRRSLSEHKIDLVQVEAGLNPRNGGHVTFEKFKALLEAFDYSLFAVTDVTYETRGRPMLRRWDAVFISYKTIQENTEV